MGRPGGPRRRPTGWLFALLVPAVLAGLLGMHGLAPGGAVTPPHGARTAHAPAATAGAHACPDTGGGHGHLAHADDLCAAAGVGSAYAPPPLADAGPAAVAASPAVTPAPASATPARAPPDLAELQLLRI
ncbi:DUF6153 family protein [Streptomyces sp. NPDC047130]|uniref:DUF6153 family protein n=1 Tax=Streptomyces sp. NPDC047130 TaxID=3155261 RepID=UPI0033FBF7F1